MSVNYLDILIAIPLAIGIYQGFRRGVIHEVLMLVGLIAAVYFAYHFSDLAAGWLTEVIDQNSAALPILSFLCVFLLVILAFFLLSKILSAVLSLTGLSFFNRVFGAVFGAMKFALILSVIMVFLLPIDEELGMIKGKTKKESVLFTPMVELGLMLQPKLYHLKEIIKDNLKRIETEEDGVQIV